MGCDSILVELYDAQSKRAPWIARIRISEQVRGSSQFGGDNGSPNGSRKGGDLFAEEVSYCHPQTSGDVYSSMVRCATS